MAKKEAAKAYVCGTCGKATANEGHLCDPIVLEAESLAVCEFCGQMASDPRHICFPKRLELAHYCEACGRLATSASLLCAPKAIPKPKAKTVGSGAKPAKKARAVPRKAVPPRRSGLKKK
jgi:hypothetical protein